MATYHLPDDAVYVVAYEYYSKANDKKGKGTWKRGQPRAYLTAKQATLQWEALVRTPTKYRSVQIIPINVYKE